MNTSSFSRRNFLRTSVLIPLGGVLPLWGCASASVFHTTVSSGRAFVPLDKFDAETTAILVKIRNVPDPVIVMRDRAGGFSAVSGRCTHLRCIVRPTGQVLRCPCHGSTFARDGSVVRGPAQAPLTQIPVELSTRGVEILLEERRP
jgi:Rieske Fe-S protein